MTAPPSSRALFAVLALAGTLNGGCAGAPREPAKTTRAPRGCADDFAPTGSLRSDLARLATRCGGAYRFAPLTPILIATQDERAPADAYSFQVRQPGACYRVYAVGDRGVRDLDLLLRDGAGQVLGGDLTRDAFPVLPPRAPLCIPEPGLYVLEVSVFSGRGRYAVQVWGDQRSIPIK
ncbi:MAG: hypothetical protein OZ921_21755 [Sorangiineae bacterium]|nr:hypothetical protein [Polyangiaceae bacterium]MEB2325154.1 hypothetical protein [Sorangiineae bacterium]